MLCDNIRLNGLDDRVAAYGLAFSDRSGLGTLTVADDEPGAAVASVSETSVGRLKQAALLYTVDDFIARFAPRFPPTSKSTSTGSKARSSKAPAARSLTRASNRLSSRSMNVTARGLSA